MNDIIDKAIKYCNSRTCNECPRRYNVCIMSYDGKPLLNYLDYVTADDLHQMIEFYRSVVV